MVKFRTPYNYDMHAASIESGLVCGPSMAHQEFKEECDINTIVEAFGLGYEVPAGIRVPTYGDYSDVRDFHSAANAIALAREAFDQLPAYLRERFSNRPGDFVDFCSDERNRRQLIEWGVITPGETHDRHGELLPVQMGQPAPASDPAASQAATGASVAPSPIPPKNG